jgi:dolichol-phosphate mannosyltransferase
MTTMSTDRTIWWVLPAYNEEASIADLIDRIGQVSHEQSWRVRVIVVDDGSADATGAIAGAKGSELPVTVLRNDPNMGLGRTLRRGLRHAVAHADVDDVIITLDADLTQDPGYAPAMLTRLDAGADVVIASRYRRGAAVQGLSRFRTILSYCASGFVMLIRPVPGVRDYSCGFRAYRVRTIRDGFGRDGDDFVSESGFACMVEIAQRLRGYATFAEVPFVLRYDAKRRGSAMRILPTIVAYIRVVRRIVSEERRRRSR